MKYITNKIVLSTVLLGSMTGLCANEIQKQSVKSTSQKIYNIAQKNLSAIGGALTIASLMHVGPVLDGSKEPFTSFDQLAVLPGIWMSLYALYQDVSKGKTFFAKFKNTFSDIAGYVGGGCIALSVLGGGRNTAKESLIQGIIGSLALGASYLTAPTEDTA